VNRRRLLQAALGAPLLNWPGAWAQAPGRTLQIGPRPAAPGVASPGAGVLIAPRHALVIGNSSYTVGPLKNPANDAKAIGEALKSQGFEVTMGLDLKRTEMIDLIGAYGHALASSKPVALFYFAGHGLQLAWRNYLVPVDAKLKSAADVQAQCVDVNAVIEGIGKAANPMNVIILDACRDDPFGGSQQKGLSQLDAPPGTLLAYATSPGNVASDGDGANGLYTENLLREIRVPEAKIEDVFKRVRLAVRRRSNGQQIPWESTSLEEDFWFIPPKEALRVAREDAERARREREAERVRQQKLEQARLTELERARQEDIERLRRAQEAERRREQAEKAREEQLEREFLQDFALWEKADGAKQPGPLEDYLRRYPSGRFAELAQLQLDLILAREGEKRIQIASSQGNPFTQGTQRADIDYKVGDSYAYAQLDLDTRQVTGKSNTRVTEVTETQVIFNNGRLIYDRLGNLVQSAEGRRNTARQDQPLEYAVGKKWQTRFTSRNREGGGFNESWFNFVIARRETITVPAGSFNCFLIDGEGWVVTGSGHRVRIALKRWMAPDRVRRPIAQELFRKVESHIVPSGQRFAKKGPGAVGEVLANERLELVAFTQS
jgi:Caspase domain